MENTTKVLIERKPATPLAIGRGQKTKRIIEENDIKLSHLITFEDGEQQKIKMLGKNSLYLFYVTEGQEEISIAPIDGNNKMIQNLKKE